MTAHGQSHKSHDLFGQCWCRGSDQEEDYMLLVSQSACCMSSMSEQDVRQVLKALANSLASSP